MKETFNQEGCHPMSRFKHVGTLVVVVAFGVLAVGASLARAAEFGPVTLPGTGDSQDLLRTLAKRYTDQFPDRSVIVPNSTGSDGGIKVVGTGESPIGRVSRLPDSQEVAQYGPFEYVEFSRVPVVFVVGRETGVINLSQDQICQLFSGRITNWKDVGGNDVLVDVQSRPDGSNLQTIKQHIPCFSSLTVIANANYNERNADLVAAMKRFPGAIGFMPLSESVLYRYQAVALDGVLPTMPSYPLGIGLGFVHKGALPAGVQAFLDYLQSEAAHTIMRTTGHVPVSRN
jgi:phosphate transport system substrate-binding protein